MRTSARSPRSFVLLHGFTGAPTSWDMVAAMLPSDARVFRPALLGHDPTLRYDSVCTFAGEVERLAKAIRAEKLEKAHLCGYSLGGRVALGLLARHPSLFSAVTLVGAHPGLATERQKEERIVSDEQWADMLETHGLDAFLNAWESQPLFSSQAALPPAVRESQRARRRAHDPAGLAHSLRVLGLGRMPCFLDGLLRAPVPVRLVVGSEDRKFTALARAMAERLPRSELTVVPGAGHNVVLEKPREVAALLRDPLAH